MDRQVRDVKVSVIMPIYNSENFLDRSIKSIIGQSLRDIEIICIDDASADCSLEKLKAFQKYDDRIVIIEHRENQGAALSRNDGLKLAKGTYVMFLDSDDYFYENMLEEAYLQAEQNQADVCVIGSEQIMESDECVKKFYPIVESTEKVSKVIDSNFQKENLIYEIRHVPWDKLVRRKLLLENNIVFQNLPANNDIFYSFSVIAVARKIVLHNKILIRYFWGRKGSLTELRTYKKTYMVEAFLRVYSYFKEIGMNVLVVNAFLNVMLDNIQKYLSDINISDDLKIPVEKRLVENLKEISEFQEIEINESSVLHPHNCIFLQNIINNQDVCRIEYWEYYREALKQIVRLERNSGMKIALWGCGERGKKLLDLLEEMKIKLDFVIDQKKGKNQEYYKGYLIYQYEEIANEIDVILITNLKLKEEIEHAAKNKRILYVWK